MKWASAGQLCDDAYFAERDGVAAVTCLLLLDLLRIMQEINVSALALAVEWIEHIRKQWEEDSVNTGYRLTDEDKQQAKIQLGTVADVCKKLGLRNALTTTVSAHSWFDEGLNDSPEGAAIHLEHVQNSLVEQLGDIRFFGLKRDRAQYYGNVELFSDNVIRAFPSATTDIIEALNCLALERNTATVFHLMRVAEFGLRALARDRQVVMDKRPLQLASWEQIIDKLEDAEERIHNYPKTMAREQQYAFYHGALMEIRRFKNVWRNNIMHARDEYDRNQALSVFNHVRDFMAILASRISEISDPLPEIWTEESI